MIDAVNASRGEIVRGEMHDFHCRSRTTGPIADRPVKTFSSSFVLYPPPKPRSQATVTEDRHEYECHADPSVNNDTV